MKRLIGFAMLAAVVAPPAAAQDLEAAEVVVTGSRGVTEREQFDEVDTERPAVGLRRTADFLVQQVTIRGDTRDAAQRRQEIRAMLSGVVRSAQQAGVELAYGDYILTTLNAQNVSDLTLSPDGRPDSERVSFLVKAPLGRESAQSAQDRIDRFVKSVSPVGRAEIVAFGDPTLSVVGPDSYRRQITAAVSEDAKALAQQLGPEYAVEIDGLTMPVQWARSGPSDVLLYIPYRLKLVPRP